MKKIKIKHTKLVLALLIVLLILSSLGYAYIFYTSYARNEFFQTSLKIANQNQNSVFRISKILLYSSANAIDNSDNKSLQNLSICQYTDIAISIDNTSYISDLTTTNTVKELYIDNLLSDITTTILSIDKSIKKKKVNKGLMFKANRNFAILERRKYGINVRILEVKDNDNLLSVVGRTNYEPLCRSFKIKKNEDINKYINYVIIDNRS